MWQNMLCIPHSANLEHLLCASGEREMISHNHNRKVIKDLISGNVIFKKRKSRVRGIVVPYRTQVNILNWVVQA